jgi:hypothetical protein
MLCFTGVTEAALAVAGAGGSVGGIVAGIQNSSNSASDNVSQHHSDIVTNSKRLRVAIINFSGRQRNCSVSSHRQSVNRLSLWRCA